MKILRKIAFAAFQIAMLPLAALISTLILAVIIFYRTILEGCGDIRRNWSK